MKRFGRYTLCMVLAVLLLGICFRADMTEAAVGDEFSLDGVRYEITAEADKGQAGELTAVLYTDELTDIVLEIPEEIRRDGRSYYVRTLGKGAFAFALCESVIIPDTVKTIEDSCFFGCTGLKNVYIGSKVSSIGQGVFSYCDSLESVVIDSANKHYKVVKGVVYTLSGKTLVSAGAGEGSLKLPEGLTGILAYAFEGNSKVTAVTFPDTLKTVGKLAFYDACALEKVTISASVSKITDNPFASCNSLKTIKVDKNNEDYKSKNNILYNKQGTKLICGMTVSGEFTIPKDVLYISDMAFLGNSRITSLNIPASVQKLCNGAFYDCTALSKVSVESRSLKLGSTKDAYTVFGNTYHYLEVTIPYSKKTGTEGSIEERFRQQGPSGIILVSVY